MEEKEIAETAETTESSETPAVEAPVAAPEQSEAAPEIATDAESAGSQSDPVPDPISETDGDNTDAPQKTEESPAAE